MPTARRSVEMENVEAQRAQQEEHLREAIESGALDLATRRASLDSGYGLTGDELLARVLNKRTRQRPSTFSR